MLREVCGHVRVLMSNLTLGDGEETHHHIIHIVVLQIRVVPYWWVIT